MTGNLRSVMLAVGEVFETNGARRILLVDSDIAASPRQTTKRVRQARTPRACPAGERPSSVI